MVQTKFKIKNNLMLYDVAAELMKETPDEVIGFTYQTVGKLNGVQTTIRVDDVILSLQGHEVKIMEDYGDFISAEYKFISPGGDRGDNLVSSWEQITLGKNMIEEVGGKLNSLEVLKDVTETSATSATQPIYPKSPQTPFNERAVVDHGGPLGSFDVGSFYSEDLHTQIQVSVDRSGDKVNDIISVFMELDKEQINQENKLLRFALLYIIKM